MSNIHPKTIEEMELLFQFVPPQRLRERVQELFFHYLSATEPQNLPEDFREFSEDVYFLIRLLEKIKDTSDTPEKE